MFKIKPKRIKEISKEPLDMTKAPIDDEESLNKLNNLDVFGIFQFESDVAINIIKTIGIDSFEDMYAATTLGRPDPLSGKLHITYGKRKRNEEKWESIECVSDIMDQSYNLPLFQESSMILAQRLANFSGSEANALRKGLAKGKDNKKAMENLQNLLADFKTRSQKSVEEGKISQKQLDYFVTTLENFGGYGFNKSHAVCYAMVAYWSLFLKTHFPLEFMVALLNFTDLSKKDKSDEVILKKYIQYAKKINIEILPPNINDSEVDFSLKNGSIRWGFGMIKGLAKAAVEEIINNRPYNSFDDFISKVERKKVNKTKVLALIKSGSFDKFDCEEDFIIRYYKKHLKKPKEPEEIMEEGLSKKEINKRKKELKAQKLEEESEEDLISTSFKEFLSKTQEKKVNKKKVFKIIKKGHFNKHKEKREFLINYYLRKHLKIKDYKFVCFESEEKRKTEEELLGFPISFSKIPKKLYEKISEYGILKIEELMNNMQGDYLGVVGQVKKTTSKKSGKEMLIVSFSDDFNSISFFVWEKDIENMEKILEVGKVMVIPLKRFDFESDGCFFSGKYDNIIDLSEKDN